MGSFVVNKTSLQRTPSQQKTPMLTNVGQHLSLPENGRFTSDVDRVDVSGKSEVTNQTDLRLLRFPRRVAVEHIVQGGTGDTDPYPYISEMPLDREYRHLTVEKASREMKTWTTEGGPEMDSVYEPWHRDSDKYTAVDEEKSHLQDEKKNLLYSVVKPVPLRLHTAKEHHLTMRLWVYQLPSIPLRFWELSIRWEGCQLILKDRRPSAR
jgi:hypothetical protein